MPDKLFPGIFQPRYFAGYNTKTLEYPCEWVYCQVIKHGLLCYVEKVNCMCNSNEHTPARGLQVLNLTFQQRRICLHQYTVCPTARCSVCCCFV